MRLPDCTSPASDSPMPVGSHACLAPTSSHPFHAATARKRISSCKIFVPLVLASYCAHHDPSCCEVVDIQARHVGRSIGCCWAVVSSLIASYSSTTRARFWATAAGSFLFRACLSFAGPPAALDIVSRSYPVRQHRLKCVALSRRAPIARHEVRLSPASAVVTLQSLCTQLGNNGH